MSDNAINEAIAVNLESGGGSAIGEYNRLLDRMAVMRVELLTTIGDLKAEIASLTDSDITITKGATLEEVKAAMITIRQTTTDRDLKKVMRMAVRHLERMAVEIAELNERLAQPEGG